MIDNRKEDYAHAINRYTKNIIEGLIPKRIVPFDYYEERKIDEEVKNWIERSEGEFAVINGDAGFGKTSLLCNVANVLLNEERYAIFFVKSENLRGKDFDKKILDDLEIKETGLNALLRKIDKNKKVIFLLDTLDLIATDDGITRLDDFLTKVKGENRVVIGASRPLEFKKIENLTTKTFALKPFSDAEIQRLFEKYKAFYSMEGVELRLPVLEVCRNPLHMRMLFEVYQPNEIPEDINTQKLYDKYWDKKVAEIRIGALSHLDEGKKRRTEEIKEDLTENIASKMLTSKEITLRRSNIKKIKDEMREDYSKTKIQYAEVKNSTDVTITQIIKELIIEYDTIIDDAYHDLVDEGVLRAQDDSIEFFHQSFFEYAVARMLIEEEDKEQLEYLLNNTPLLENRAIIQQLILYAKRKKKDKIAHEFLRKLLKTNLHTKMLAIDLLKHIENLTEEDIEIYQHLTEDKIGIRIYFVESLELILPVHPGIASRLIENLSYDEHVVVRKAVAKALPMLLEVNQDLAFRLIKILRDDEDVEVKLEVLFSQMGDILDDEAENVRENVEDVFPEIDNLSNDLDSIVRRDVAMVLSENMSNDEDVDVLEAIAGELPKIGNLSNDLDSIVRRDVADVLSEIENLSNDEDMDVREAVAEALPKLLEVNPDFASSLFKNLSNAEDMAVRSNVAKAQTKLLEVNPDLASRLIGKLCNDKDSSVRGDVAKTLPELLEVNPDLASYLIEKLSNDKKVVVRRNVVVALLKLLEINPDLASRLIEKLSNDKNVDVRREVAETLSEIGNLSNYEYRVPRRRRDVIEAFAEFMEVNPDFASSLFKNLSNDKDWLVRRDVAEALPKLLEVNPDLASCLIENLHNDEHGAVRNSVAKVLPELLEINPDLASRLIENLRNDEAVDVKRLAKALPKLLEVNPNLASRLIENLGNLVPFIEDEAVEVREAVEKALLKFAELSPNKACALIEKLKDTEGISIQKAIKKIIEKRHLDRFQHDEKKYL